MNNLMWVKCHTLNYYQTIKKISLVGINIFKIHYTKNELYLKINKSDYERLQKYLSSYKFIKVTDLGLIKIKEKIKEYKVLLISFILGIIVLLLLTNIIIDVRINHESTHLRELLLEELDNYGIKKLSFKKSFDKLEVIKKSILDKYPDKIDWLEFEMDGMILNVKVEERIITDINKDDKKCDIVATKEGTISSLKVEKGEALVRENDVVKEGDTLISGIITYNNEEKMRVCAKGDVYAHTWYTIKVSIPLNYSEYQTTGKKKYNLIWINKDNKKLLLKERFNSYNSKTKPILKLFDYQLLWEIEEETTKNNLTYTEEEALNVALEKGEENLRKKLGENDTIIDKKVLKKSINNSKMEVEIFMIVNEKISSLKEIMDNFEGMEESDTRYN